MAIDKKLRIFDTQGNEQDYDIMATDVKFLPDGKDLPTKLAEISESIGEAGQVNEIIMNGQTYAPTNKVINLGTVITQHQDISGKVDKVPGKGLSTNDFTDAEKTKLAGIAAGAQVNVINGIQTNDGTPLLVGENGVVTLPNIEGGETVVASVDDIDIVDNMDGVNADTILAAASARMVKEIYLNLKSLYQNLAGVAFIGTKPTWQTVAKRTYTIGMAAADQYITLTDGNGNAVASPQNEGTPLTLRLSVANGYRFASVPTATMGNTNITFSLVGSAYVAEIGALAGNIVITASSVEVGTYSVNIPTGAVFCTSSGTATTAPSINEGEGVTCYIKPADGKRWSTTPSSTGATVTLQSGSIYKIVASNVQADITVSGATENIPTYSINLPSAGNGIASVALTDANDNVITSPVLEGTAVKIVLTPSPNHSITVSTATMESGGVAANLPSPTNVNGVLTYTIASVTGDIVITATAHEVVALNVFKNLLNMTASNAATSVEDGSSYTTDIVKDDAGYTYNDDLRVLVGGVNVTSQCTIADITNGKSLTIPSSVLTSDVEIIATAATGTIKITMSDAGSIYLNGTSRSLVAGENTFTGLASITNIGNNDTTKTFFGWADASKCTKIDLGGVRLPHAGNTFRGLSNVTEIKGVVFPGDSVGVVNMFTTCNNLERVDLSYSGKSATSLEETFKDCLKLLYIDISCLNGKITNIGTAFWDVGKNTQTKNVVLRIGNLDLSEVSTTSYNAMSKIKTLICTTTTPPDASLLTYATGLTAIYVPSNAVNSYKTAWSSVQGIIHSINEYNPS